MRGYRKNKQLGFALLIISLLSAGVTNSWAVWAGSLRVAVIYPEIREPYRSVFRNVVQGIGEKLQQAPKEILLEGKDTDITGLERELIEEQVDVVIALGRKGLIVGRDLAGARPVVAGATLIPPGLVDGRIGGITLTPDPAILLQRLRRMAPKVERVTVVYNPAHSGWLIELARKEAMRLGLALDAQPATDLKEAAPLYRAFINQAQPKTDALWLLRDASILDERAIVPMLLSRAWDRHLVVVSNNPAHVRKGALFSLYPDNVALGRSLAAMAQAQSDQEGGPGIQPLRDLLVAVNLRTAGHLGIRFTNQDKRGFAMLFPSR